MADAFQLYGGRIGALCSGKIADAIAERGVVPRFERTAFTARQLDGAAADVLDLASLDRVVATAGHDNRVAAQVAHVAVGEQIALSAADFDPCSPSRFEA